jgi:hypothetical protein
MSAKIDGSADKATSSFNKKLQELNQQESKNKFSIFKVPILNLI